MAASTLSSTSSGTLSSSSVASSSSGEHWGPGGDLVVALVGVEANPNNALSAIVRVEIAGASSARVIFRSARP